jgi:Fur family transcriptional regulator, peroxide stress response regulator
MNPGIIDTVIKRIKERGGRVTVQRLAIINVLMRLDHPTAEDIYQYMRAEFPTLSFTTVYNTLKSLKDLDVVREYYQDERSRFEISENLHHHFHCIHCNRLIDIEPGGISVQVSPEIEKEFGPFDKEVILRGTCLSCRAKQAESS